MPLTKTPTAIRESDRRIAEAMRSLRGSPRGRDVLRAWFSLMRNAGGTGLDGAGWYALQTLVNESANGRRDYLDATVPFDN
jgi:hypothetical protein